MASSGGSAAGPGAAAAAAADAAQRQLLELAAERLAAGEGRKATPSSNYDYVKVKIRLGSQLEHYYILSRFLLSRMLTVITLPQHKAGAWAGCWRWCRCSGMVQRACTVRRAPQPSRVPCPPLPY